MAMEAYRAELGMVARAVGNGEMSIRQAEEVSGFSRSAIQREVSHRKEIARQWDSRRADGDGWPGRRGVPQE